MSGWSGFRGEHISDALRKRIGLLIKQLHDCPTDKDDFDRLVWLVAAGFSLGVLVTKDGVRDAHRLVMKNEFLPPRPPKVVT